MSGAADWDDIINPMTVEQQLAALQERHSRLVESLRDPVAVRKALDRGAIVLPPMWVEQSYVGELEALRAAKKNGSVPMTLCDGTEATLPDIGRLCLVYVASHRRRPEPLRLCVCRVEGSTYWWEAAASVSRRVVRAGDRWHYAPEVTA